MFFLCDREGADAALPGGETIDARFFSKDALPPLSRGRTIESDIEAAFLFAADATRPAFFD